MTKAARGPVIATSRLCKSYEDHLAVSSVNLHVWDQEWVFIIGENGAGKSTLLRLLTREETPTSGQVLYDGRNIRRLTRNGLAHLRRNVACIWQDNRLISYLTVWENVAFALEVRGIPRHALKKAVDRVLDFVDLLDFAKRLPNQLSGGEQQRVAIARALVIPPRVLVADEPTSNLSPYQRQSLIDLFKRIHAQQQMTLLIATHDVEMVNALQQRVIQMAHGTIISDVEHGIYPEDLNAYERDEEERYLSLIGAAHTEERVLVGQAS